jgi:hypothetical protein
MSPNGPVMQVVKKADTRIDRHPNGKGANHLMALLILKKLSNGVEFA